mgnify:FL=1
MANKSAKKSAALVNPLTRDDNEKLLTGWGRTAPSMAHVVKPGSVDELRDLLAKAGERGILARGLGRSYGDAAQAGGGTVLDMGAFDSIDLDTVHGTVTAGSGVSLDSLLKTLVPAGYFVPVTPGTRMITVGGAIAADVHGKNHHVEGSFGSHVHALDLVTGHGRVEDLAPTRKA